MGPLTALFPALSFAQPAILLGLLALPALYFLLRLMPPPPKSLRFPGLFFLRGLKDDSTTPAHAPWWLLLLRLAIMALILIGLAGPVLNKPDPMTGTEPVVFVVDNSWPAAARWELRRDTLISAAAALRGQNRLIFAMTTAPVPTRLEEAQLVGPLSPDELRKWARSLEPTPFPPDHKASLARLERLPPLLEEAPAQIHWLSDGVLVTHKNATPESPLWRFVNRLTELGAVIQWQSDDPVFSLHPFTAKGDGLFLTLRSSRALGEDFSTTLKVTAQNGRELLSIPVTLPAGEREIDIPISLPFSLRNEIATARLQANRSAGAVQLADASTRRVKIGLVERSANNQGSLLDGATYLQQALAPYASLLNGDVADLMDKQVGLIILDDIGRMRDSDVALLETWVSNGGILLRFAGPSMADAIGDNNAGLNTSLPLTPGRLRFGGRAFGGALTWEQPQNLTQFTPESPFADLTVPEDIIVRRQILTDPLPDRGFQSWALLADGTPLITAQPDGKGLLILFHVATTPDWSDLPISGGFVMMLRRILTLPVEGLASLDPEASFAPLRIINGYGGFDTPASALKPISFANLQKPATPETPPGFYGDPDAPIALNAIGPQTIISPLSTKAIAGFVPQRPYQSEPAKNLAVFFLVTAFLLTLIDSVLALWLRGFLPNLKKLAPIAVIVLTFSLIAPTPSQAQELPPIDGKTMAAALQTRLAYIETGDSETDRITRAGLATLSNFLYRRTALEPAAPVAIDLEADDLSVYPLLYWVISEDTSPPSDYALGALEEFMNGGGLLIIDTRDGDVASATRQTPAGEAMRRILSRINIPPLEPLPAGHVLGRSFYLLDDLPGRNEGGTVWVKAASALPGQNDGVTPIIIGGRDWAGAWAIDSNNVPYLLMGTGGIAKREYAFRSGINMVMVALTGSYKIDQLHVDTLLEQLGQEGNGLGPFTPDGGRP